MRTTNSAAGAVAIVVALLAAGCATSDSAPESSPTPTLSNIRAEAIDTTIANDGTIGTGSSIGTSPGTAASTPDATTVPATDPPSAAGPPARLDVGRDAEDFAARLSVAHATITDVSALAEARERAGVEYQLLLRALAELPDLDDVVLDLVDPSARPATERIIRARQFVQQRSASRPSPQPLPDELPAWTIVAPEPIDVLLADYGEAERLTGIPWYWLAAIHLQETRMGRIEGVSSAGAVGPMQFLPTTWAQCCTGDPTAARDAIIGAATYLAQSGGPLDMAAAVYQYNPNDGYVAVVTAYAETLRDEPELYTGYHAFQVFFGASVATVRLPIGYSENVPIDAATYLTTNPTDAA